ncbi:hypothetical protein K456DRAFT_1913883 [Colletotrichum gloeosporioides 23]|nr:hypothetical protein K456DRAFT_1913883 [Colletotrichum gloeosporioides 23]
MPPRDALARSKREVAIKCGGIDAEGAFLEGRTSILSAPMTLSPTAMVACDKCPRSKELSQRDSGLRRQIRLTPNPLSCAQCLRRSRTTSQLSHAGGAPLTQASAPALSGQLPTRHWRLFVLHLGGSPLTSLHDASQSTTQNNPRYSQYPRNHRPQSPWISQLPVFVGYDVLNSFIDRAITTAQALPISFPMSPPSLPFAAASSSYSVVPLSYTYPTNPFCAGNSVLPYTRRVVPGTRLICSLSEIAPIQLPQSVEMAALKASSASNEPTHLRLANSKEDWNCLR